MCINFVDYVYLDEGVRKIFITIQASHRHLDASTLLGFHGNAGSSLECEGRNVMS